MHSQPLRSSSASLSIYSSKDFAGWLGQQRLSLALSTYQIAKLLLLGLNAEGRISILDCSFDLCMGLTATANGFYMGSRCQVWRFENILQPGQLYNECDRLYVPQVAYTTGDCDSHDLGVDAEARLIFVNTAFGCLCALSETNSFRPIWKPPFISDLVSEDRCHLNGLAMKDGRPAYVTAVSQSNVRDGWRDERSSGGVLIDVLQNQIVAGGLSMPHSPRIYQGKLWLCQAGTGEFGSIDFDTGEFLPVCFSPGFLRGLCFHGDFAILGLSKPRYNQAFQGLKLHASLERLRLEPQCGLEVVHLPSGVKVHSLYFDSPVGELYDVMALPGVRSPMAIDFRGEEINQFISMDL